MHQARTSSNFGNSSAPLCCYEVQFGSGIQEITDSRGIFRAHCIHRAYTGEESSSVRRATCCKFIQCIGGVEQCHAVPAVLFTSTKEALGESRNFTFSPFYHFAMQSYAPAFGWINELETLFV
jgi:hypothetical protein